MSKQLGFFATIADMSVLLSIFEQDRPCQYTLCGLFGGQEPETVRSHRNIPKLGIAIYPTGIANPCYLVSPDGARILTREVRQGTGRVLFAVDQLLNPDTVTLRPSGRHGDSVILAGSIGTASISHVSTQLFKILAKLVRREFSRMNAFYLGPDALSAWKSGARLTIAVQSPPEFDLRKI